VLSAGIAAAQTYGFATMQPGTLNHTSASAVAKVLKDKAGLNVVVQPTAGESVMIPLLRAAKPSSASRTSSKSKAQKPPIPTCVSSVAASLRGAFWVRKDTTMKTIADLKGKKVGMGYSAMRTLDPMIKAILATGGLTEKDVTPVLIPNVIRGADDFTSGAADMFFFAFGAPKVRRSMRPSAASARWRSRKRHAGRQEDPARGLSDAGSAGPFFIGVDHPMSVYTWDNMIFTNNKVTDDAVYKLIDTLEKNKADLVSIQPALREFSARRAL
jgi:hypothetical protein